ncbi:MAG TPA: SRPBCC family protein [Chitinophagaceae bacterium]|nr:SRPBCC family protein [Chitinophagaceae bacterium]
MLNELIAKARININVPIKKVWEALVNPALIKQYMFGTNVASKWKKGSAITWQGEWEGKKYEDKGTILLVKKENKLQYTHFSPLSGKPDIPENYNTVTVETFPYREGTSVIISQDNNPTEEAKLHSEKNWRFVLEGMKKMLEQKE